MMYLTTANVKDYLGKTLDVKKRILGLYPYKVIQTPSGEYLAVDRAGVGVVIAQPHDMFNAIYIEIVDGKEQYGEFQKAEGGQFGELQG